MVVASSLRRGEDGGGEHDEEDLEGRDGGFFGEGGDGGDAGGFVDDADGDDEGEDEPEPVFTHGGVEGGEGVVVRGVKSEKEDHRATSGDWGRILRRR